MTNLKYELELAKKLAIKAGNKILEYYNKDQYKIEQKNDESPLTTADTEANKIIIEGLKKEFPNYAILSEEEKDNKERLSKQYVWIVDPLDGTKEFISKNGEFTVNIALTKKGLPVIGVIYIPVKKQLYFASENTGAYLINNNQTKVIRTSEISEFDNIRLVKSRSHASEKLLKFIEENKINHILTSGSSLKGCMVAKGDAETYIRFGRTCEWDICAMNCIINESGAVMTNLKGQNLKYNKENIYIHGFVVTNNNINKQIMEKIEKWID